MEENAAAAGKWVAKLLGRKLGINWRCLSFY